jgi:Domain of unknown function (DUF6457)
MDAWLRAAADAIGAGDLSDDDVRGLLDIARTAAHESGDRTNAPLLCYLLGRAQGDRPLDEVLEAIRSSTS